METLIYLVVLLVGWWLPAALFYGVGAFAFLRVKKAPFIAVGWTGIFLCMLAYALYDGIHRRHEFEERTDTVRTLVPAAAVPAGVRTIVLFEKARYSDLVVLPQQCANVCAKLLLGGRFDRVVLAHKYAVLSSHDEKRQTEA